MAQDDNSINHSQDVPDQEPHYRFGAVEIGIIVASCVILASFFITRFYIHKLQRRRQLDMEFQARQRDLEAAYEEDCKQRVASMVSDTGAEAPILKGNITIQSKINNESENKQMPKPPLWCYINSKHPRTGSVTLVIPLQN